MRKFREAKNPGKDFYRMISKSNQTTLSSGVEACPVKNEKVFISANGTMPGTVLFAAMDVRWSISASTDSPLRSLSLSPMLAIWNHSPMTSLCE
jgi:hypothetical protein